MVQAATIEGRARSRGVRLLVIALASAACTDQGPRIDDFRGDDVKGATYDARALFSRPLPAEAQWRARDGSCAPGHVAEASFAFSRDGQLEIQVRPDSATEAIRVVSGYSQDEAGGVSSAQFTGTAAAHADTLWVTTAPAVGGFCADAGPMQWLAVRRHG